MGILGSYLNIEVDGLLVAETTDVNMKIEAKALDATTKVSGYNYECIGGTVKIAIAGSYLMSQDGANWEALWASFNAGSNVTVAYYRDAVNFFSGYGIIKRLTIKGGNSDELITGGYGIMYSHSLNVPPAGETILTESGIEITTETGETLLVE
jgi:hypothetical protein